MQKSLRFLAFVRNPTSLNGLQTIGSVNLEDGSTCLQTSKKIVKLKHVTLSHSVI